MPDLLIPRSARPSRKSGYARSQAESANPRLRDGLVGAWSTGLGPTGTKLINVARSGDGVFRSTMAASSWERTEFRNDIRALNFVGSDDGLTVLDKTGFNGTFGTLAFSLRKTDAGKFFSYREGMSDQLWVQRNSSTELDFLIYDASTQWTRIIGTVNDNIWTHVVCMWNNGTLKMYVDGVESGSQSGAGAGVFDFSLSDDFFIGWSGAGAGPTCKLANISLYDRILGDKEIRQLSTNSLAPFRLKPRLISIPAAAGDNAMPMAIHQYKMAGGL